MTYPTIPLKEIEIEERPQERLLRLGASALSDSERLAMILRSGTKGTNVLVLAKKILKEASAFIQKSRDEGNYIVVMGDMNGRLGAMVDDDTMTRAMISW